MCIMCVMSLQVCRCHQALTQLQGVCQYAHQVGHNCCSAQPLVLAALLLLLACSWCRPPPLCCQLFGRRSLWGASGAAQVRNLGTQRGGRQRRRPPLERHLPAAHPVSAHDGQVSQAALQQARVERQRVEAYQQLAAHQVVTPGSQHACERGRRLVGADWINRCAFMQLESS